MAIGVAAVVVPMVLVFVALLIRWRFYRVVNETDNAYAKAVPGPCMPYHVLREITNRFSDDRKLGEGAHGSVYLGKYRGETVVVKVFSNFLGLDDAQFQEESLAMARLQHKNIVRLVGYCHETKRKIDRRVHCLEYMGNGSLDNWLSDESSGHGWHTRYAIIKGICKGLEYLHEGLEDPMFHLDLKPKNILLDNNMVPKIKKTCGPRLRGEELKISDYVPPEYIKESVISKKFDIFSLGILILKIITGPKCYSRSTEMSSHAFIENVYGNWRNRLIQETYTDKLESYCKQVKTCIEIALSCVEADQHKRPSIADIVHELNETETATSKMRPDWHHLTKFQYLRYITKEFSEDQIIGKGGSGVVYKGTLPSGELIAVKKVQTVCSTKELCDKSTKLFENEFTLLMRLEHQNIVQLKEYCYEKKHAPSVRGENFVWQIDTLLCLEFYPKGSLKSYISDAASGFDWGTRYKTIEGISYGVQYLHDEQSEVPIIHMDLKPENILLDANMVPKIADFGISRLFDQGKTIHTDSKDGTLGYMPPEYIQGLITPMWDIFSLGVIIMEITTGHRSYPYDYNEAS